MALKWMALILIVALSGTYGLYGAKRLERRVEELKELRMIMNLLKEEIYYLHTPLPLALKHCAERCRPPLRGLFRDSSYYLEQRQGMGLEEAWDHGLNRVVAESRLKTEDITVLRQLAYRLGASGLAEQEQLFIWLDGELRRQLAEAEQERSSGGKLWSYGGFMVGAVVAILLI